MVLPKEISELIAAGEVVERPASVIKELVENSVDAHATAITVEIERGGITYMRVTDNGIGMKKDQVKTAFLRHATSKIKSVNDLDSILTLGFRGEALASISSVAHVQILTATEGESGVSYEISGGEEIAFEQAGCPKGTTIIVKDLFYNVPARMKFLKKDVTEGNAVASIMDRIALSHPEISFKLIRDGKIVLNTTGDGKQKSAVYSVLGRDFSASLIPVEYKEEHLEISGFVSMPTKCKPNRNGQFFFLNGRFIKSGTMSAALDRAYQNSAMVGKFPACVINLTIPAGMVDVNVHPTKTEVRFTDEHKVFDVVYRGTRQAITLGDKRPEFQLETKKSVNFFSSTESFTQSKIPIYSDSNKEIPKAENTVTTEIVNNINTKVGGRLNDPSVSVSKPQFVNKPVGFEVLYKDEAVSPTKSIDIIVDEEVITKPVKENIPTPQNTESQDNKTDINELDIKYIGEAFATYIIVSVKDSLYLIDKHAAHERINFEKLKNNLEITSQMLVAPVSVTLVKDEFEAIISNVELLEKTGFIVEDFGGSTVVVRGVPAILDGEDVNTLISEVAETLRQTGSPLSKKIDDILHSIACKSAIKAGNITSKEELEKLAIKVLTTKSLMYCPHGRPIAFELKRSQIEKQFGRLG